MFALQRRRARRQGLRAGQVGAVSFIQFFGSALQVTPHFHSLVPDGVFVPREGSVRFEPLPPPTQGEVERLLRVVRLLEKRGALPAQGPEDALQAYQAHSLQQRLRWTEVDRRLPPSKQPRCALLEGFSLHANTHLHANDRQGLERLCRYGARGALALERLSRMEDGRIAYRMKRPLPDGTTHLLFTGLGLLRRVASLVPPPRANLTRFHGVLAPGAQLRPFLVPRAGGEERSEAPQAAASTEPMKEKTPRGDFADRQGPFPEGIAYPMPEKPFKEQSKPPCVEGREEEVRGGCWIPHAKTAPCSRGTAELQGKCYVPVKKPDPAPTSVQP
ncbi:transposase [Hyalangium minutum]|uniref:transposase n=1 Tax=Hyalangium minutum TaxID=394096 RepID=UPI0023E43BCC|nr:transposase [Hyalangium minutum]